MVASVLLLLAMLLLSGLVLCAVAAALMLRLLLRPARMTDGKALYLLRRLNPGDLGLEYQDMTFFVRDQLTGEKLRIAAWWMPNPRANGKCAVLIHGYSDAKVGAIAWAPLLHAMGYHCFALDLRAHGHSDGKCITGGYFERYDVDQVLHQLRALRPGDTRHLVLFGISLGAAVALGVALLRDDIAAVILECPFADYRRAAVTHARLLGVPGGVLARLVLHLAQWRTGADYSAVRPVDLIRKVPCPVLVIQGGEDFLVEPEDAAQIEAALRDRDPSLGFSELWRIPNAGHVMGLEADPEGYRQRVASFLGRVMEEKATHPAVGQRAE